MKSNFYIDISAIEGEDLVSYDVLAKAFHVLHGAFSKSNGRYAVAFPTCKISAKGRSLGNTIRVFASESSHIFELMEATREHFVIRDYVHFSAIKSVPSDYSGSWSIYRRARLVKTSATQINSDKNLSAIPFLEIKSSSGNRFPLRILKESSIPQVEEFMPNTYGLAALGNRNGKQSNIFSLPDL
jgi:CRISPR-associated protein (Cas_Csy4)